MTKRDVFSIALTTLALVLIAQFLAALPSLLGVTINARNIRDLPSGLIGAYASLVLLCLLLALGLLRWAYRVAGWLNPAFQPALSIPTTIPLHTAIRRAAQLAGLGMAALAIPTLTGDAAWILSLYSPFASNSGAAWAFRLSVTGTDLVFLLCGLYMMTGADRLLRFACARKCPQ